MLKWRSAPVNAIRFALDFTGRRDVAPINYGKPAL